MFWIIVAVLILAGIVNAVVESGKQKAARKRSAAEAAERQAQKRAYNQRISSWMSSWRSELDDADWIPADAISQLVAEYPPPSAPSFVSRDAHGLSEEARRQVESRLKTHNNAFKQRQKSKLKTFFDTVEKNPLTDEQIAACICMDPNVQIVAAAGSGKTSTMVAKAGYVIKEGLAAPGEILMLAFNSDAAKEMESRVRTRLSSFSDVDKITARTFHAFGLHVIATATGRKPSIASWAEPGKDLETICSIIDRLSSAEPDFQRDWSLFKSVYSRDIGRFKDRETPEDFEKGTYGFRTDGGIVVKSKEERAIANWLYYNGIRFDYEKAYRHDTADSTHRQYHPDFYYPQIELYHEHFALNQRGEAPPHFTGYLNGVAWKRQLHAENGTHLFETHSHHLRSGKAFDMLECELRRLGLDPKFDPDREPQGPRPMEAGDLARLIRVFQQHVKSNGLSRAEVRAAAERQGTDVYMARIDTFISIYERISDEWDDMLRKEDAIDFEDMLIKAAQHLESGNFRHPFRVVLADEFQDSSRARIRLLKALTTKPDSHLCVVGDDWQGINRFAGADISVMTEFKTRFPNATILALSKTFRCPKAICDASSQFVQANPAQIRKSVSTTNTYAGDALLAFAFADPNNAMRHLSQQFDDIMREQSASGPIAHQNGRSTVMILGRYKSDRPQATDHWQRKHAALLDIHFRTIHSSKGLEADYVVIMNMVEGVKGFPSMIQDDPLLQIPMPTPDPYPFAEERRLFYVALTRAKRQVWLYTSLHKRSRFLNELEEAGHINVQGIDGTPSEPCSKCGSGTMIEKYGKYGPFRSCNAWPRCRHTINGH